MAKTERELTVLVLGNSSYWLQKNKMRWVGNKGERNCKILQTRKQLSRIWEVNSLWFKLFILFRFGSSEEALHKAICLGSGTPGWVELQGQFMRRKRLGGALYESAVPGVIWPCPEGDSRFIQTQTPRSDGIQSASKTL